MSPAGFRLSLSGLAVVLLLGIAVLLAGCETLGYQPSTVAVSRDALVFRAGRASAIHDLAVPVVTEGCQSGAIPANLCRAASAAEAEYQALASVYREAIAKKTTPPDPEKLLAAAEKLLSIAGPLLLSAAGIRLPSIGGQ